MDHHQIEISVDDYLRGSSDHVLNEIPVSRGINDSDIVLGGLELPESNIDGDSSLTLSLQFVKNPGILEGSLQKKQKVKHSNPKSVKLCS